MNSIEYKLIDVVNLKSGTTVKKGLERESGEVAYIKVSGMNLEGNEVKITTSNTYLNHEDITSKNILPIGTTIFPKRGGAIATNKKRLTEIPLCVDLNTMGAIPKSELVIPLYIYFYFQSFDLLSISNGTTIPQINNYSFDKLKIFVPQIPEQKRMVTLLETVFADLAKTRAKTEQNLKNATELFDSYLDSYFNPKISKKWDKIQIENACISIIDCINKTAPKVDYPTEFKMIRTTNVRHGLVNLKKVNFVTKDTYIQWTRRQTPEVGDVILTREAPMGEVGMLLSDEKVFLGQRLVSYRADPDVLNKFFLLFAFQSKDIQEQISLKASGSTVQHMRVPDTKTLKIPLPSLKEQGEIVQKLESAREKTKALLEVYTSKLSALDELKKSILHKAFNGELTTTAK